jgi:hypothetical protein
MRPTVAMLIGAPMAAALVSLAVSAAPALADPPGPVPDETVVFWSEPDFAGIQQSSNATRGSECNRLRYAAKSAQFAHSNPTKLVRLYKTTDCADNGVVTTLKPGATWNSADDTAALGWRIGGGGRAERTVRADRADRADRTDRTDRAYRAERTDRAGRSDRAGRGERAGQAGPQRRHGFRHR